MILNCAGKPLDLAHPQVMGILNVTPDSFYDGGKYRHEKEIIERVTEIVSEGGDFVDIGGYSTRPGAPQISEEEELARLLPAVMTVKKYYCCRHPSPATPSAVYHASSVDAMRLYTPWSRRPEIQLSRTPGGQSGRIAFRIFRTFVCR